MTTADGMSVQYVLLLLLLMLQQMKLQSDVTAQNQ